MPRGGEMTDTIEVHTLTAFLAGPNGDETFDIEFAVDPTETGDDAIDIRYVTDHDTRSFIEEDVWDSPDSWVPEMFTWAELRGICAVSVSL